MSDSQWSGGGCLCGAVRYEIDRTSVLGQSHCHCRDCQRATGSAFATFCFVSEAGFRAKSGTTKGFAVKGESGGDVERFFCGACGSQLYSKVAVMPGVYFVKAGSLDDASWMQPQSAFWNDSAQPWVAMPEDVVAHARNPG